MAHIALVDDESNILTSVSLALESEGFTVDTYLNGEQALAGLEKNKYDFEHKLKNIDTNLLPEYLRLNKHKYKEWFD